MEKARALYEWIVDNTFRDPKVRGCGLGDIQTMLETKNLGGKCADLNALFVGFARSVGIPARDVYGIRVADSADFKSLGRSGDITKAQHCRAEFYLAGHGWVPVDPADVRKVVLEEKPGGLPLDDPQVQKARAKLFGAWEMNWMAYNYAHDVTLPGSTGAPARLPHVPAGRDRRRPPGQPGPGHVPLHDQVARDLALAARAAVPTPRKGPPGRLPFVTVGPRRPPRLGETPRGGPV